MTSAEMTVAIAEAQHRLEMLDTQIKTTQWDAINFKERSDAQVEQIRQSAFRVLGEIDAYTKLKEQALKAETPAEVPAT